MQTLKRWFITLFFLFAIVALLGFVKFTQIKAAIAFGESFPEPSETVEAINTSFSQWQPQIELIGEVKATRTLQVRNELEGLITAIGFTSGGDVTRGDVLVQLDISTEKAQLDAIKAQIQLAELDVTRFQDLLKSRAGSREQLDRAKAQLAIFSANARALETTIKRKTITAPFSGNAAIHEWEVGTYIPANTLITNLIGDTTEVWIDFSLPQRFANTQINAPVTVIAKDAYSKALQANISAIDQRISSSSRSLRVRASLSNDNAKLKPGSMVSVLMPTANNEPVIKLPNAALRFDTFGSYVFLLEKDVDGNYRAKRQVVKFKSRELNDVIISDGLSGKELVATVGSAKLSEGILVKVAGAK